MVNHFLDAIAQKALPELRDMLTDDVVLLSASGPPTIGRDVVETLCRDLLDRFDIRHHVDFGVEVIEVENAACAYLAPLVTAMPLDGAVLLSRYAAVGGRSSAAKMAHGSSVALVGSAGSCRRREVLPQVNCW